jgi:hypothetical protein
MVKSPGPGATLTKNCGMSSLFVLLLRLFEMCILRATQIVFHYHFSDLFTALPEFHIV